MSHALFLILLHGRGVSRAALNVATMAGICGLLIARVLERHASGIGSGWQAPEGRAFQQVLLFALILGGWVVRWRYDALLRRLCPSDTTLFLLV